MKTLNRKRLKRNNPNFVYYEAHHILPKSIYPELKNNKDNIVLLTAREHFLAHYLLTKIYKEGLNHYKMLCAFYRMTSNNEKNKKYLYINSRLFEKKKLELSKERSRYSKEIWKMWKESGTAEVIINKRCKTRQEKGYNITEETRQKIRETLKETYKNHPEIIENLKKINTGKNHSEETKRKMSQTKMGHSVSEKTKEKLRLQHSTGKKVVNLNKKVSYPSLLYAQKITGINRKRIKNCIEKNIPDLNGDYWKYE